MPDPILKPLLAEMAHECYNPDDINTFIDKQVTYPWLKQVYNHGKAIGVPMFDLRKRNLMINWEFFFDCHMESR